jgi:hypothetical protein
MMSVEVMNRFFRSERFRDYAEKRIRKAAALRNPFYALMAPAPGSPAEDGQPSSPRTSAPR